MTTPLQKAAQALIQQWDSPGFIVDDEIAELRKALDAELQQSMKPFAYINKNGIVLTPCDTEPDDVPLYLHPPQQVAVTSGERAELLRDLDAWKDSGTKTVGYLIGKAMDMLEADAQQAKQVPMTDDQITNWYASENGLEDCSMSYYPDFEKVVRAVERRIGGEA